MSSVYGDNVTSLLRINSRAWFAIGHVWMLAVIGLRSGMFGCSRRLVCDRACLGARGDGGLIDELILFICLLTILLSWVGVDI